MFPQPERLPKEKGKAHLAAADNVEGKEMGVDSDIISIEFLHLPDHLLIIRFSQDLDVLLADHVAEVFTHKHMTVSTSVPNQFGLSTQQFLHQHTTISRLACNTF